MYKIHKSKYKLKILNMYKKTWFGQEVILPGPEVRLRVYVLKTITPYFM